MMQIIRRRRAFTRQLHPQGRYAPETGSVIFSMSCFRAPGLHVRIQSLLEGGSSAEPNDLGLDDSKADPKRSRVHALPSRERLCHMNLAFESTALATASDRLRKRLVALRLWDAI